MAGALIHIRVDGNHRDRTLLSDVANLRKEGLATDTRVVVMEENDGLNKEAASKGHAEPILAHSLVLAAASSSLADILASSGDPSEGFTIILIGVGRLKAEAAIRDIYLGKKEAINVLLAHEEKQKTKNDEGKDVRDGREDGGGFDPTFFEDVSKVADLHKAVGTKIADLHDVVKGEADEDIEAKIDEDQLMEEDGMFQQDDFSDADDEDWNPPAWEDGKVKEIKQGKGRKYDKKPKEYKCLEEDCSEIFLGKLVYSRHLKEIHRKRMIGNYMVTLLSNGNYKCPECFKEWKKQDNIAYHLKTVHGKDKKICPICGQRCMPKTLKSHMLRRHSEGTFVCDKCEYTTHVESSLKYHMHSKHDGIRHICEECGKDFAHKFILAQHVQDKHSEKIHFCDQCDYTFKGQSGQLEIHKKLKHSETNLLCAFCDFQSPTKEAMDEHRESKHKYQTTPKKSSEVERKIRESQKEFICKICHVTKKSRATLGLHIRSEHEGIRYNCSVDGCKFSGKQKTQLEAHMNAIHLNIKLPCDFCDYKTAQASNLRLHMMKKHGVKPFSCDKCDFRCHKSERMQHHMLYMH